MKRLCNHSSTWNNFIAVAHSRLQRRRLGLISHIKRVRPLPSSHKSDSLLKVFSLKKSQRKSQTFPSTGAGWAKVCKNCNNLLGEETAFPGFLLSCPSGIVGSLTPPVPHPHHLSWPTFSSLSAPFGVCCWHGGAGNNGFSCRPPCIFPPSLLCWRLIAAEGRLCGADSHEAFSSFFFFFFFFFNAECLQAEAMLAANPTLQPS